MFVITVLRRTGVNNTDNFRTGETFTSLESSGTNGTNKSQHRIVNEPDSPGNLCFDRQFKTRAARYASFANLGLASKYRGNDP